MADTGAPFSLRYQTLADTPDGPALGQNLASDVAGWLSRAYPVANAAARQALSVGAGFIALQQDDFSAWIWSGATWVSVGASGGGGSGVAGVEGQWRANSNQDLPNGIDTVLAFGATETDSALVTRTTSGSGHKFTLGEDATWSVTATVRFVAGNTGSRFIELRDSAQTTGFVSSGDQGGPAAATRHFSVTKRFSAGQELIVVGAQSSGGTLSTQFQGSSPIVYRVRLTICKVAD